MHVLVVGGTKGIGLAIAQACLFEGQDVTVWGRQSCGTIADPVSGRVASFRSVDLSDTVALEAAMLDFEQNSPPLDALFATAAEAPQLSPLAETSLATFQRAVAVNVTAPFMLFRWAAGLMAQRNGGVLVALSSRGAMRPAPGWGAYGATKAAMDMLTRVLALELAGSPVRVYAVNPGATRTGMRSSLFPQEDPSRLPHPLENVGIYMYLLREQPTLPAATIDAYDWLSAHEEWREYGRKLFERIGANA